jgi:hypothetical protein
MGVLGGGSAVIFWGQRLILVNVGYKNHFGGRAVIVATGVAASGARTGSCIERELAAGSIALKVTNSAVTTEQINAYLRF